MTTSPVRVLVVDDEPLARERLEQLLNDVPEFECAGTCPNGHAAVKAITAMAPDVVLLDVQMPGLDGFGVIAAVGPESMPPVIFVSAFDEYAVRAFEVHALDYVEKPWERSRMLEALERGRTETRRMVDADLAARLTAMLEHRADPAAPTRRLIARRAGAAVFLDLDEVDWVESAANYLRIHAAGEELLLRETLTSLVSRLPESMFVRVHRSALVRVGAVRELRGTGGERLILKDGIELSVGPRYRAGLQRALGL